MNNTGTKYDDGKTPWGLLPINSVKQIVDVLAFGAKKYSPNNWKKIKNGKSRYWDACIRHLMAWKAGERIDSESGLPHLAHAGCCILFLMWFDR